MSRNMIFGGIMAAVLVAMLVASIFSDHSDDEAGFMGTGGMMSDDEPHSVVRVDGKTYKCPVDGSDLIITREDGTEITIICE